MTATATATGPVLAAVFCGAPHPLDPTVLCTVIGPQRDHSPDGEDPWRDRDLTCDDTRRNT